MRSLSVLHVSSYFQKKCALVVPSGRFQCCLLLAECRGFLSSGDIYISWLISHLKSCLGSTGHCCWRQTVRVCLQSLLRMLRSLSGVVIFLIFSLTRPARAERGWPVCSMVFFLVLGQSFIRLCCKLRCLSCAITRGQQSDIY